MAQPCTVYRCTSSVITSSHALTGLVSLNAAQEYANAPQLSEEQEAEEQAKIDAWVAAVPHSPSGTLQAAVEQAAWRASETNGRRIVMLTQGAAPCSQRCLHAWQRCVLLTQKLLPPASLHICPLVLLPTSEEWRGNGLAARAASCRHVAHLPAADTACGVSSAAQRSLISPTQTIPP